MHVQFETKTASHGYGKLNIRVCVWGVLEDMAGCARAAVVTHQPSESHRSDLETDCIHLTAASTGKRTHTEIYTHSEIHTPTQTHLCTLNQTCKKNTPTHTDPHTVIKTDI